MTNAATPTIIKKYANRRLYNTATSSYVTLEHLCQLVKNNEDFVVYDAKSGDDITRSVLTQIIVEEEGKGQNLLPISFLRKLISFYGDSLSGLIPKYLEYSMQTFLRNEEHMREYTKQAFDGLFPFSPIDELGKQNLALFESAMKMFTPFYQAEGQADQPASKDATVAELQARIEALQAKLDSLSAKKKI